MLTNNTDGLVAAR